MSVSMGRFVFDSVRLSQMLEQPDVWFQVPGCFAGKRPMQFKSDSAQQVKAFGFGRIGDADRTHGACPRCDFPHLRRVISVQGVEEGRSPCLRRIKGFMHRQLVHSSYRPYCRETLVCPV